MYAKIYVNDMLDDVIEKCSKTRVHFEKYCIHQLDKDVVTFQWIINI